MSAQANGEPKSSSRLTGVVAWLIVVALVVALWLAIEPTLAQVQFSREADEGCYLRYLERTSAQGLGVLPTLTSEWLADKQSWVLPPTTRVGFIALSTWWSKLFGVSFIALAQLSLASFLALVVVQFFFARRHFGDVAATLIALLTAAAPLYLGLSRRALTDSTITLLQVTTLWLFFEIVSNPRKLVWQLLFVASFTCAVATKELAVLLALPMVGYALIERFHRRREVPLARLASLMAAPIVIVIGLWIAVAGGVEPLTRMMSVVMHSPAKNEYAIQFGSGPWSRYVIDELAMSPWSTCLGLAGIAVTLWRWRGGEYRGVLVFFALVYVAQIAALAPFTKNLRYAAVLEVSLRISAVALLLGHSAQLAHMRTRIAACAIVGLLAWGDYATYRRDFVGAGLYDPVSAQLLLLRGMLPRS